MTTKRVILYYYFFQFFFSLLFWVPIFYEYQKAIGLTDTEIFAIQSAYYIAFALMEIPTGMLADRIGYRYCMIAGAFFLIVSNLFPIYLQTYSGFYTHFMLIGLSRSLISGASSAYLYEFLKAKSAKEEYRKFEGRARSYGLIGKVICWAAVGFLMQLHFTLPYSLTVFVATLSLVFALLLPDFKDRQSLVPLPSIMSKFMDLAQTLRNSPALWLVMFQGVSVFVLVRVLQVNLFQPVLKAKNFSVVNFGLMMAMMSIFEALGSSQISFLARWKRKIFKAQQSDMLNVSLLSVLMAISVLLIPLANSVGTIICFGVFGFVAGSVFPIQKQLMNDTIAKEEHRATLLSVESIIDRVLCAVVAALLGDFLSKGKLYEFLYWVALATLVLIAIISLLSLRRRKAGTTKPA